jgi:dUTP pyrophosphatase
MTQTLEYKKLRSDAIVPSKKYNIDACYDLFCIDDVTINPNSTVKVGTGLAFQCPSGFYVEISSRSGHALNRVLSVMNSPGKVDEGFTGEVCVILFNGGSETQLIKKGAAIAQMELKKRRDIIFREVMELKETERGTNGFGSTNK